LDPSTSRSHTGADAAWKCDTESVTHRANFVSIGEWAPLLAAAARSLVITTVATAVTDISSRIVLAAIATQLEQTSHCYVGSAMAAWAGRSFQAHRLRDRDRWPIHGKQFHGQEYQNPTQLLRPQPGRACGQQRGNGVRAALCGAAHQRRLHEGQRL